MSVHNRIVQYEAARGFHHKTIDYTYYPDSGNVAKYLGDGNNRTWTEHHNLASATSVVSDGLLLIANNADAGNYQGLYVSIIGFKVGALPSGIILSAKIRVYGEAHNTWTGTNPSARWYKGILASPPNIAASDWNEAFGQAAVSGSKLFSDMLVLDWYEFPITDLTYLRPDGGGYIWFWCMDNFTAWNAPPYVPSIYRYFRFDFSGYVISPPHTGGAELVITI